MAALITGGAGFVGSHLTDRCISEGEQVIVCDDMSTGRLSNLEYPLKSGGATLVYIDVASSADEMRRAIAEASDEPITQIFHLASPASPDAYGAHPWETLAVNGRGTMSLIELALAWQVPLLFASTSEVYGDPLVHPQPESYFGNVNSVGPRACYDEGKRFGEAAMSIAINRRGLNGRIVRLFNCYGPRMSAGDGRLIPALLAAAQAGRPFPIHGTGQQTRSMTYVDDIVSGLLAVMDWRPSGVQPVNLGSEEERSVLDIAAAVASVAGVPFETEQLPRRPEDPQQRRPDAGLARSIGCAASTSLHDGLRKTYEWHKGEAFEYAQDDRRARAMTVAENYGALPASTRGSASEWFRARPWLYVELVLLAFAFMPLIHRLVDWKIGYSTTSLLSIVPQISMLPAAAMLVYSSALNRVDKTFLWCAWLWIGGFMYSFAVGVATHNVLPGIYSLLEFLPPAFIGLWVASLSVSPRVFYERIAGLLLAISVPMCLYAAWQYAAPPPWDAAWMRDADMLFIGIPEPFQLRPFSTLNGPPQFADFLLFVILFNLPRLRHIKPFPAVAMALCAGTLVLTQVRADWITLALALLCYILLSPARLRNLAVVGAMISVCVIVTINASLLFGNSAAGDSLQKRISTFTDLGSDVSVNERTAYFGDTLSAAIAQPTGQGLGVTGQGARLGSTGADVPYDDGYIARFVEMGYFGMACYLLTLIAAATITLRRWHAANRAGLREDAAILASFASIQVALLVLDASIDHHNGLAGVFFWLTFALAYRWRDALVA